MSLRISSATRLAAASILIRPALHTSAKRVCIASRKKVTPSRSSSPCNAQAIRALATQSSAASPSKPYKTHQPTSVPNSPLVHSFWDEPTSTFTFVVVCPKTKEAFIIDPVLDFDLASGKIAQRSVKGLAAFTRDQGYRVVKIIETHVHADHLSGAYALKQILPEQPSIFIGSRVIEVQFRFGNTYGFKPTDYQGSFDGFMLDNEPIELGEMKGVTYNLPGHTPDSMAIAFGDAVFAGDSVFLPDVGTARTDFPGGSPESLYASIQKLFDRSGEVRIFSGHDYPSGREKSCVSKVSDQMALNKHVGGPKASLETFVKMRSERDAQLGAPKLLHPSLQVNLRGGRMPRADPDGQVRLKIPLAGDLPV